MNKIVENLKLLIILSFFSIGQNCFAPEGDEVPEGWKIQQGEIDPEIKTVTDPEGKNYYFVPALTNKTPQEIKNLKRQNDQKYRELYEEQRLKTMPSGWKPTSELYPSDVTNPIAHDLKIKSRQKALFAKNPNLFTPKNAKKFGLLDTNTTLPDDLGALQRVVRLPDPGEDDQTLKDALDAFYEAGDKKEFITESLIQMDETRKMLDDPNQNLTETMRQDLLNQLDAFERLPDNLSPDERNNFLQILEEEKAQRAQTPSTQEMSDEGISLRRSSLNTGNLDEALTSLAQKTVKQNEQRLLLEAQKKATIQTVRSTFSPEFSRIPGVPQDRPQPVGPTTFTAISRNPISGYVEEVTTPQQFQKPVTNPSSAARFNPYNAAGYSSGRRQ